MIERVLGASSALLLYDHDGGVWLGTAIALRLGDRHLLATAAHNVKSIKYLRLVPRGCYRGDPLHPVRIGIGAEDTAWIEVCPRDAAGRIDFLEPSDLAVETPAERSHLLVHGFPAHGIAPELIRGTRFQLSGLQARGFAGAPEREGELLWIWGEAGSPVFHPTGLSGGGIWRRRNDGSYALVGLVRAWHRPSRCLLGIPIERWLQIYAREHAERS